MGGTILKTAKIITKTAEKITMNATNGDITLNSAKAIKYSAKKNIVFGEYKAAEPKPVKSLEFKINIKLVGDKTFVPLGIPSFIGKEENQIIKFEVEVLKNPIEGIKLEIFHNGKVIRCLDCKEKHSIGKHYFGWNGFDDNGIYDSTIFTTGKLRAKVTGTLDGKINERKTDEFSFEYTEVNWVDTKINKNTKRIDVTLRVNIEDGGEIGTEKDCYETGSGSYAPITKHCPWDKIHEKDIDPKDPILKKRNKNNNFDTLKQLALDGIEKYWERNSANIGKGVYINKELYEVYLSCKQDEQGMVAPEIIFFTNSENGTFNRSHNWFASRKLYYKEGYLKNKKWDYRIPSDAAQYFKETAAHEIGHQLLVELKGKYHSYTHKGTSHPSVIIQDPIKGTKYPTGSKEIDLMKYADDFYPYDYYKRVILSEKDLLGLLWLTKLELN